MEINRRRFVAIGGGLLATAGGIVAVVTNSVGDSEQTMDGSSSKTIDEPPDGLEDVNATATTFARQIKRMYPKAYVGFTEQGEIVCRYAPDVSSGDALKRSINEVIHIYVETCREETPAPLIVRSGGVRAIVPITPLEQYLAGELESEAFEETIIYTEAPE